MDILIIEDDAGIRDMLTMLLEDDDHSVTGAANGQQALNHLRQRERLPQLILLDLAMPIMNGWQFRAAQHADPRLAAIPVIVLSADRGVKENPESISADAYLAKPVLLCDLVTVINQFGP